MTSLGLTHTVSVSWSHYTGNSQKSWTAYVFFPKISNDSSRTGFNANEPLSNQVFKLYLDDYLTKLWLSAENYFVTKIPPSPKSLCLGINMQYFPNIFVSKGGLNARL